jgi:hypothetical protein
VLEADGSPAAVLEADGSPAAVLEADGSPAAVLEADGSPAAVLEADGSPAVVLESLVAVANVTAVELGIVELGPSLATCALPDMAHFVSPATSS